jgi:hypothetical protein
MNGLQIGDGFKFGCGFFLAGFVAYLVILLVTLLLVAVVGGGLGALFQNMQGSGLLLPLLGIV